jgi:hypothetical protein
MHCRSKFTFFALPATWVVSVSITQAEPLSRDHRDHDEHRGYVLDERYHHNRYYPPSRLRHARSTRRLRDDPPSDGGILLP